MNLENAKQYINQHAGDLLEPDGESTHKSEDAHDFGYICPLCGSGSGDKGTGMKRDPKSKTHFKCFACGFYGDIVQLIAERDGLSSQNYMAQLKHVCKLFNLTLEGGANNSAVEDFDPAQTSLDKKGPSLQGTEGERGPSRSKPQTADYSEQFREWNQHLSECDYLTKRGINPDLQNLMNIGFCANYKNNRPALIIPNGTAHYIARFTDTTEGDKRQKYDKKGTNELYNAEALYTANMLDLPAFIVEGEIDALSFMELGIMNVIALGSATNQQKLIDALKELKREEIPALVLALDNDKAGSTETLKLAEKLGAIGARYHLPTDLYGEHKDANECLQAERDAFKGRLDQLNKSPTDLYNETSAANDIDGFLEAIEQNLNAEPITTGFFNLNTALDGGLYAGLYVIGAISSLGKTTFTLQMADAIAAAGHDVLIFSLEMAKRELMAKSISRLSLQGMKSGDNTAKLARSVRDLLGNVNRNNSEQMGVIKNALERYRKYASNIFIVEGLGDVDIDRIKNTIAQHVIYRKRAPVVVIDYLQIIAPYDPRSTDKQNTDKAVLELKRISRDFKTPVLAISSFNRDNYSQAVNMASFKESGAIEYSSDVLLGLQLSGVGVVKGFDVEAAMKKNPREVELKILKNRNGQKGEVVAFDFYPMYNYFEEV